jgi:hypothetical protein
MQQDVRALLMKYASVGIQENVPSITTTMASLRLTSLLPVMVEHKGRIC